MIETVKQIKTMKAVDLPPTFDVQIGTFAYPMEIERMDAHYVYMRSTDTDETIYIPKDEEITILVPDTWENAALDIEFDLMQQGLL
jgi:hypothetical protein